MDRSTNCPCQSRPSAGPDNPIASQGDRASASHLAVDYCDDTSPPDLAEDPCSSRRVNSISSWVVVVLLLLLLPAPVLAVLRRQLTSRTLLLELDFCACWVEGDIRVRSQPLLPA